MLPTESYASQKNRWPASGRHILAYWDDSSVVVYQAYRRPIGEFALRNGHFGGEFSYSRMSWVKPNFLWMMYRCGWGTKPDQDVVLAVRIGRAFFERLLGEAVESKYSADAYPSEAEWQQAINRSEVRLQWDPDHAPNGAPVARRALQLGLRGKVLEAYGRTEILEVLDMTEFVASQRGRPEAELVLPLERVYQPSDAITRQRLGLSTAA
jgi:hypothetical protein